MKFLNLDLNNVLSVSDVDGPAVLRYFNGNPDSSLFSIGDLAYFSSGVLSIKDSGNVGVINFYNTTAIDLYLLGLSQVFDDKLTDIVKAVNITSPQFTITAGQLHIEQMTYTIPDGYKFLCLANITTSGFILPATTGGVISPTSGTFSVYINNLSSIAVTGGVIVTILFIKDI